MPLIYRAMRKGNDGLPETGADRDRLGVRPGIDVKVDSAGNVGPSGKGMSVSPTLNSIHHMALPARLQARNRNARGDDANFVWRHGAGPFSNSQVATGLNLHVTSPGHGVVEPQSVVALAQLQADLAATRTDWTVDET